MADAVTGPQAAAADAASVRLRRPTAADLDALAGLHAWSWQVTYGPMLTADEAAVLTVEERRGVWRRVLAAPEPREAVWLAEAAGDRTCVGLVWTGTAHPSGEAAPVPAGAGEIHAIHVAPGLHGRGIGRLLIEAAEADLREQGFRLGTLWVITDNAEARRFYEGRGWRPDGASKRGPMGGFAGLPVVGEVRYAKPLGTEGPGAA